MRLFITGSTGFIGRHLLNHLEAIPDIELGLLLSANNNRHTDKHFVITGRLENIEDWGKTLKAWQPDACIHLAWYAEPGKYLYATQNVTLMQQSLDLMQVLIDANCQSVVMVGTVAEYDVSVGYLTETSLTKPDTIYAASKLALSIMAERMAIDAGIQFAWARMFYLYGPEEDERRLVAGLINKLMRGERFQTTPGEQVRDYLHVSDAASALWYLVKGNHSGIYNVSSGFPVTVSDLIQTIANKLKAEHLVDIGALPYRKWEPMFICGDNEKLRLTGWNPQYTLKRGLESVVEWWERQ